MLRSSGLLVLSALALGLIACRSEDPIGLTTSSSSTGTGGAGTGGAATTSSSSGTGGAATTSSSSGTGGMGTGGMGTGGMGTGGAGTGGMATGGTGGGTTTSSSSSTSSTTTSSSSSSSGTGGMGPCGPTPTMPAAIVTPGPGPKLLLRGKVVTPDQAFDGEVLVEGDTITCVAASCGAADIVVDTHGAIFPGLIDTHNHIQFDIFDETHWSPMMSYGNHNQWTNEAKYGALVDAKQWMNGEGNSTVDFSCELNKYGELKGLVAGTTSIVGAANPANKTCFGSLARTIDQSPNGLGADKIQVSTLFPPTGGDGVCTNFTAGTTDAFVVHCGEGVDNTALNEFNTLNTVTTTDGCLLSPKTTIVHGTAFGAAQLDVMAQNQMSLVWSPKSNVFLYGAGTDLTKTTNIPYALSKGINVAIGPDWSIGGSQNLLDELRFADHVDNTIWGDILTPEMLVKMVTTNAAKALGLSAVLGSITVGKKADLMVIGLGDMCSPYEALLAATPASVRLVMVGGVVLYGDGALKTLGPAAPGCEDLDVCGASKFACVARSGGTTANKFGQTLADITKNIDDNLAAYDAMNLSQWNFSPRTPIVRCP